MKRLKSLGLAAALIVSGTAFAQQAPTPEQQAQNAIQTRQGLFKVLGATFGPIGGMLQKRVPFDAALVEKNAQRIEVLAGMITELFQNDTRQFHGSNKTGALDGIWSSQADFKAKSDELVKAAQNLVAAAKSGDQSQFTPAAGAVWKACGNCHDSYRAK